MQIYGTILFLCNFRFDRWMARDQDDFDIVRELPAVTEGDDALPGNEVGCSF